MMYEIVPYSNYDIGGEVSGLSSFSASKHWFDWLTATIIREYWKAVLRDTWMTKYDSDLIYSNHADNERYKSQHICLYKWYVMRFWNVHKCLSVKRH